MYLHNKEQSGTYLLYFTGIKQKSATLVCPAPSPRTVRTTKRVAAGSGPSSGTRQSPTTTARLATRAMYGAMG